MKNTAVYARIIKQDKQPDGTLLVQGIATDDSLDIDEQICDPAWLSRAMPEWFKWGNIREQHSQIAAGVATEYKAEGSQHIITARVVDPNSVKKVESGVLKGFSIGIRGPRVMRDGKAAGGRIVDGTIVEVSLVDRPANPTCLLSLAKSVDGEVKQVEELIEKYSDDQPRDEHGRFGEGGGVSGDNSREVGPQAKEQLNGYIDTLFDIWNAESGPSSLGYQLQTAMGHLSTAANAETVGQARDSMRDAKENIEKAIPKLENENLHQDASTLRDISVGLTSLGSAMARGVVKSADITKYSDDQERDENGRFAGGGGSDAPHDDSPVPDNAADGRDALDSAIGETRDVISDMDDDELEDMTEEDAEILDQVYDLLNEAQGHLDEIDPSGGSRVNDVSADYAYGVLSDAWDLLSEASSPSLGEAAATLGTALEAYDQMEIDWRAGEKGASIKKDLRAKVRGEAGRFDRAGETAGSNGTHGSAPTHGKAGDKVCKCGATYKGDTEMCAKCAKAVAVEESSQMIGEESSQNIGEESSREGGVAGVAGLSAKTTEQKENTVSENEIVKEAMPAEESTAEESTATEESTKEETAMEKEKFVSMRNLVKMNNEKLDKMESLLNSLLKSIEADIAKAPTEDIAKAVAEVTERVSKVEKSASRGPVRAVVQKTVEVKSENSTKAQEYRAKAASATDPTLAKGYLMLAAELETQSNI